MLRMGGSTHTSYLEMASAVCNGVTSLEFAAAQPCCSSCSRRRSLAANCCMGVGRIIGPLSRKAAFLLLCFGAIEDGWRAEEKLSPLDTRQAKAPDRIGE